MNKLISLLIIILCSCLRHEADKIVDINLLSSPDAKINLLSDIATSIEYFPLQTTENSLIRHIYDIKSGNDKIYLSTLSEVLCFDRSGNYLFKLSKQGRGPEEYTYIYDFDISSDNLLLILIAKKILIYSVTKDGFTYLKTLSFKNQPSCAEFLPAQNNILLAYNSTTGIEPYQYVLIDFYGDTLTFKPNYYKFIRNVNTRFGVTFDNIFFKNSNSLQFKGMLNDTVFTIDKEYDIKPNLILNSQGMNLNAEFLANYSIEQIREYVKVYEIMAVSRYLFYKFSYKTDGYFEIYDYNLGKRFEIDSKIFIYDDIIGGSRFEPKFCSNEKLYSWIDPFILKKYVTSEDFKKEKENTEKKNALKKLADSLNETDNPVLIVVTPKN